MRLGIGVLVFIFWCSSLISLAQAPTAVVNGQVRDTSGSAIPNASVEVINDATNLRYVTETNDEGIYSVPNVPPGTYHIRVSKQGFKTIVHPDITLNVQDAKAIGFTLPVGPVSDTVTVEGGAPLVNTQSAAVSTVIDRTFVENLPLNGRSFNTLLQLTPGVVIAPASSNNPGQFSIAGQRTDANNFMVDGVSANFGVTIPPGGRPGNSGTGGAQALSAVGGTSSLVSVDALQEFRIETSSFAPEFGRTPGGQVILSTRSGTNNFHGGAFDYFRNTVMDANDWFLNNSGQPRTPEHHNDFGGYLGGPIWKDKTFFFFSYEGARLRLPQAGRIQVPSEYARATAPSQLAPYLNAYPHPNDRTQTPGVYTAPFTGSFSNRATLDATSIRIDHTFNNRFSIFGRFNDAPSELVRATSFVQLDTIPTNTRTLTMGLNMLFSSRMSNTVRGNYSEQSSKYVSVSGSLGGAAPLDASLLVGSLSTSTTAAAFSSFQTPLYTLGPQLRNRSKQVNMVDDLSMMIGTHRLKMGGDYRALWFWGIRPQNNLNYSITTIQNFISGASAGKVSLGAGTNSPGQLLTHALSLYAQDSFQVAPRLVLVYGVRWELNPPPSSRGTTILASYTNVDDPTNIGLAPSGTPPWSTRYRSFAPRFGIAYGLTSDLVLRAGAGVFYDLGIGAAADLARLFPNSRFQTTGGVSVPVSNISSFLPALSFQPPFPFAVGFRPDLKVPRSYQWNVALEKSFAGRQAISVTYVGQAGRDLLRQEALVKPNANFLNDLLLTDNSARSNYNALQVQYRRPLSPRLQALLNYSWSHSLDVASSDAVVGLSSIFISAARDYGSSDFDVRHAFTGALTYTIPSAAKKGFLLHLTRDWFIDTTVVAHSGFPFNTVLFFESPDPFAFSGGATTRADRVPGQSLWTAKPTAPGGKILNSAAFTVPSTVRQGTEGRNDIPGFGLTQVDLSFGHKFASSERLNLLFRADAFNLFNHPNFANPSPAAIEFGASFLQSPLMLNRSLGGGLNSLFQEGGPRSLQLSLKLSF